MWFLIFVIRIFLKLLCVMFFLRVNFGGRNGGEMVRFLVIKIGLERLEML